MSAADDQQALADLYNEAFKEGYSMPIFAPDECVVVRDQNNRERVLLLQRSETGSGYVYDFALMPVQQLHALIETCMSNYERQLKLADTHLDFPANRPRMKQEDEHLVYSTAVQDNIRQSLSAFNRAAGLRIKDTIARRHEKEAQKLKKNICEREATLDALQAEAKYSHIAERVAKKDATISEDARPMLVQKLVVKNLLYAHHRN